MGKNKLLKKILELESFIIKSITLYLYLPFGNSTEDKEIFFSGTFLNEQNNESKNLYFMIDDNLWTVKIEETLPNLNLIGELSYDDFILLLNGENQTQNEGYFFVNVPPNNSVLNQKIANINLFVIDKDIDNPYGIQLVFSNLETIELFSIDGSFFRMKDINDHVNPLEVHSWMGKSSIQKVIG